MGSSELMENTVPTIIKTDTKILQKPPWSPALIATITILFTVLPGGIFHALNYERLWLPQKKAWTLKTNLLLFLFIFLASFRITNTILFGLFQTVFHIGCATHFYKTQSGLYQKHLTKNHTKAPISFPLFISFIVYLLILGLMTGLSYLFDI